MVHYMCQQGLLINIKQQIVGTALKILKKAPKRVFPT